MKNYEKPTVETVKFNDVITTSNGLSTVKDSELLGNDNDNFDILWND